MSNLMQRSFGKKDNSSLIESKAQLVEYLESGCKPPEQFRLGAEQEQFVFRCDDLRPADYDGSKPGIRSLLDSMTRSGWEPIHENGLPISLRRGDQFITIEPGGQFELSGAPLDSLHEIFEENREYHHCLEKCLRELGLCCLAMGHQPKWSGKELPWMPKDRYRIMREYMPTRGSLGLEMMQATCSIQVNLDFSSESDMVKKFRVALALQPLVTALFANSPFSGGEPNGYLSYRSRIWRDTDDDRCGSLPFVFEDGMGFERYADYALDVPMYFVNRNNTYIDASGQSFRDFLKGRLPALPGQLPTIQDWENHLSTIFPNVRLKKLLEMRGADAGDPQTHVAALAALCAGVLYDAESLGTAWDRIRTWSAEEHLMLESGVVKTGFSTPFRDQTVQELCLWMLKLSREGLERRGILNQQNQDESHYLAPIQEAAKAGQTFAEQTLHRYETEWDQDIDICVNALCREASL